MKVNFWGENTLYDLKDSSPKNENYVNIYSPLMLFQTYKSFLSSVEHKIRYFEECWWLKSWL